jgi:hypothetical protein
MRRITDDMQDKCNVVSVKAITSNRGEKGGWERIAPASNENFVLTGTRLIRSDVIRKGVSRSQAHPL